MLTDNDGVIFAKWKVEGDKLVRTMIQPSEDSILAFNRELQKNPGAVRDLDWGKLALNIPDNVYWFLVKQFPDLNAQNAAARTAAWLKLYNSREFESFRVTPRSMARG